MTQKINIEAIGDKRAKLASVKEQLKKEFFGLDTIIDKVINSISAWYIFPEIITRPVIINLWGMTGVGKTHLVRRLVELLNFSDKFAELQMNLGTENSFQSKSILNILSNSKIEEGAAGILLIDEMQRFKTVAEDNTDIQSDAYQDLWMLLSDGRFSANASVFKDIETLIAQQLWAEDQIEDDQPKGKKAKVQKKKFRLYTYEANALKKLLRLSNPLTEIMEWDMNRIFSEIEEIKQNRNDWTIDYTKLLIFISGNLDSAFTGANSIEDCDTDADFYHELTSKINASNIKSALLKKFRPEQISRFGNNHVIYPSLNKESYNKLIRRTCDEYLNRMKDLTDIVFTLSVNSYSVIYENSVYPTQGTRPVFSAIHQIFSNPLQEVTVWALENQITNVYLDLGISGMMYAREVDAEGNKGKSFEIPVNLEISDRKAQASRDFKKYIAVHEAGHAIAYTVLNGAVPMEVKVNTSSFSGGYMLPEPNSTNEITTKKSILNDIVISLAGMAAEELFFGKDLMSTGSSSDRFNATSLATKYVRRWGFDDRMAQIFPETSSYGEVTSNDMSGTNEIIEKVLKVQYEVAKKLIEDHFIPFKSIVNELEWRPLLNSSTLYTLLFSHIPNLQYHKQEESFSDIWSESSEHMSEFILEEKDKVINIDISGSASVQVADNDLPF